MQGVAADMAKAHTATCGMLCVMKHSLSASRGLHVRRQCMRGVAQPAHEWGAGDKQRWRVQPILLIQQTEGAAALPGFGVFCVAWHSLNACIARDCRMLRTACTNSCLAYRVLQGCQLAGNDKYDCSCSTCIVVHGININAPCFVWGGPLARGQELRGGLLTAQAAVPKGRAVGVYGSLLLAAAVQLDLAAAAGTKP